MSALATITGGASFRPAPDPDTGNQDTLALASIENFAAEADSVAQIRIDADDAIIGDPQSVQIELMDIGGTFTAVAASNIITTSGAHLMLDGDEVRFTNSGGALPAGLTAGVRYYVRDSTPTTFKVALQAGGTQIDITDTGTGTHSWQHYGSPDLTYAYPTTGPVAPVRIMGNRSGFPDDFTKVKGFMVQLVPTNAGELVKGTFTVDAGTDVITTSAAHGKTIGQRIQFESSGDPEDLPAPLESGTDYYVLTTPAANTMTIEATVGGGVINITDAGTGTHSWKTMGDANGKAVVTMGDPSDGDNYISIPLELYYRPGAGPPEITKPFWCGSLPEGVSYDSSYHLNVYFRDNIGNQNLSAIINLLGN